MKISILIAACLAAHAAPAQDFSYSDVLSGTTTVQSASTDATVSVTAFTMQVTATLDVLASGAVILDGEQVCAVGGSLFLDSGGSGELLYGAAGELVGATFGDSAAFGQGTQSYMFGGGSDQYYAASYSSSGADGPSFTFVAASGDAGSWVQVPEIDAGRGAVALTLLCGVALAKTARRA